MMGLYVVLLFLDRQRVVSHGSGQVTLLSLLLNGTVNMPSDVRTRWSIVSLIQPPLNKDVAAAGISDF